MHKCPNCGQEFEGKFCPECGEQWQEKKICPQCGATLSGTAKFCNECGYSFVSEPNKKISSKSKSVTEKPNEKINALLEKIYPFLKYVPVTLFALFSVLLFAFLVAPMAVIPEIGESYGSVYSLSDGILDDLPELLGSMIAIIVLSVLCFLYTVFVIFVRYVEVVKYSVKYKTVNFFGVAELNLIQLFEYISFVFYLIFFIIGCICCGIISALDEGIGLVAAGACPILLIVFPIIFALLSAGVLFAKYFIRKKFPLVKEKESEKDGAEFVKFKGYVSSLSVPVEPVAPIKVERPVPPQTAVKIVKGKRTAQLLGVFYIIIALPSAALFFFGTTFSYIFNEDLSVVLSTVFIVVFPVAALIVVLTTRALCPVKSIKSKNVFDKRLLITVIIFTFIFLLGCFVWVCFSSPGFNFWFDYMWFIGRGEFDYANEYFQKYLPEFRNLIAVSGFILVWGLASFIYSLVVLKKVKSLQKFQGEQINAQLAEYDAFVEVYKNYLKQALEYKKEYRSYRHKINMIKSLTKLI